LKYTGQNSELDMIFPSLLSAAVSANVYEPHLLFRKTIPTDVQDHLIHKSLLVFLYFNHSGKKYGKKPHCYSFPTKAAEPTSTVII